MRGGCNIGLIVIQLDRWLSGLPREIGHEITFRRDFIAADVLIADTKPLDLDMLHSATKLKGIVRLGVGFDNLPPDEIAKQSAKNGREIVCAYTPNAPSRAVAELTIGLMIDCARGVTRAQKAGVWTRVMGRELQELTLGVIGVGRIGKRVIHLSRPLVGRILACDPVADTTFDELHGVTRMSADDIFRLSDIVTLHIPLTGNQQFVSEKKLTLMPDDGILLNTSRGGVVDEGALARELARRPRLTAAIDVFGEEPYSGPLLGLPNAVCTCHMGAMTVEARHRMETEALEAAHAILNGWPPRWIIPFGGVRRTWDPPQA